MDGNSELDLISIVLPTYCRNYNDYLKNSIESVLSQTYQNFELIIIDDGSSDGSAQLIESYCCDDPRIKYLRFDINIGLPSYVALQGYLLSKGKYICFMFDDCTWENNFLSQCHTQLSKNCEYSISYTKCELHYKNTSKVLGKSFDSEALKNGTNFIPNISVMIKRSVIEDIGWYDTNIILKRSNDLDLWLRISSAYKFLFINEILTHEYGVSLDDSLGNSVDIDLELTMKYILIERKKETLLPKNIYLEQAYDKSMLSLEDRVTFDHLLFKHFLKVNDITSILNLKSSVNIEKFNLLKSKNKNLSEDCLKIFLIQKDLLSEEQAKSMHWLNYYLKALQIADERFDYIQKITSNIYFKILNKIFKII